MNNKLPPDAQRALERVRKMLALANDAAATEGERDNAMRMAYSTLAKYNLTLAEANQSSTDRSIDGSVTIRDYPWMARVANSISQLFFCTLLVSRVGQGKQKLYVIGRAGNVATALDMTQYVIKSIDREATARSKGQPSPGAYWRNFCKGASVAVATKAATLRAEAEADLTQPTPSTGTSLVLASYYKTELEANDALIKKEFGKTKASKGRERGFGSGFYEGHEHGKKIGLNKQVASATQPSALTHRKG